MSLTLNDVQKVAKLSKLYLDDAQQQKTLTQLNSILSWIDQLADVDVSKVVLNSSSSMHERPDTISDGFKVDLILKNAPSKEHNMFCVPKVVE